MIIEKYGASAKINLFLEVIDKRKDGYHNIKSIFARVGIEDKIEISLNNTSDRINLSVVNNSNASDISNSDNLVYRAAALFIREFRIKNGVDIRLTKNIPLGAGLGGGSSDCATTLLALSNMFKINDFENVFNIGAKLGSDVPFFLRNRTFAVCEKRGEVVSPIDVKADMPYVLIVFPSINISTKRVYESMNYDYIPDITLFDSFLNELMSKKKIDFSKYLFNRLESATFAISGEIRDLKNMLLKSGVCALMSGSGSSVFAMSYDIEKLKKVYEEIYKKFDFVFLTKFV